MSQLNALNAVARFYVNYFIPVQKLVSKERDNHTIHKVYDGYPTPYQRALDSPQVNEKVKRKLRAIHAALDIVQLKR